jgi:broad specificity phosphatase PhoE
VSQKPWAPPQRRRVYLMRHGSVDYFQPDGKPVPPDTVPLNAQGVVQARAAGELFAQSGVSFDRVVTSGLTRTVQTAEQVLAMNKQSLAIECISALEEIKPGHLPSFLAKAPHERSAEAFTRAFAHGELDQPFLGGETVRSLLARVLPAFDAVCADNSWRTLLLVLHGGVNRAILGTALQGSTGFAGGLEQNPACINIMDLLSYTPNSNSVFAEVSIRGMNINPAEYLHHSEQRTTMERLWMEFESLQTSKA